MQIKVNYNITIFMKNVKEKEKSEEKSNKKDCRKHAYNHE